MTEPTLTPPLPPANDAVGRERRTGRLLVGSGVANFMQTLIIAVLATVVLQQAGAIDRLSGALTVQRDQFQACKGKPASTAGCTQPVAAEPSVIVKQGKDGLAGLNGKDGEDGTDGLNGKDGKDGKNGTNGRDGITPPCMQTPRQCMGADGKNGTDGKDGADGKNGTDGKDGVTPACWFEATQCRGADGKDGAMGPQGTPGRGIKSTLCVNGKWVITYSDGTQEEPQGACVGP
jgi:hypothetical protein